MRRVFKCIAGFLPLCLILTLIMGKVPANASTPPFSLNRFYTEYDASKFNISNPLPFGSVTDHIQYRMNCYGYAFRYLVNGTVTVNAGGGYKQQPGDFRNTSASLPALVPSDPFDYLEYVVDCLELDAARLGFSVTVYPYGTILQYGSSSRLIAVVTGDKYQLDYHFYMQHNDGTWSHKPGSEGVTNRSIDTNEIITNSNIQTVANQGTYENGGLRFLVITRDGVIDHPHSPRNAFNRVQTLYDADVAGDEPNSSADYGNVYGPGGRFDFGMDVDCFYYYPGVTGYYSFTGNTANMGSSIHVEVYDTSGNVYGSASGSSSINVTAYLTAGNLYFAAIWDENHYQVPYSLGIFVTY